MVTDTISNFIVSLKNASAVHKDIVLLKHSSLLEAVAKTLERGGFIKNVSVIGKGFSRKIQVELIYEGRESRIHGVERISKPSRRIYQKCLDIRSWKSGYGSIVFSTPKGILSDKEALKHKVGGEILFKIW